MPEWLAQKFDALPSEIIRSGFSKGYGPKDNYRTRIQLCVAALYCAGWTLDQALALAPFFPSGFGALGNHAAIIREAWHDRGNLLADAAAAKRVVEAKASRLFDPWSDPLPPEWPGGVLSREAEDTIAQLAIADGVDFGALALAYIAAASGAAPKDSRFAPYGHSRWTVPPILWVMLVADSGSRKTAIMDTAFAALRRRSDNLRSQHKVALREWRARPDEERRDSNKPTDPHSFLVQDIGPEKLQMILAESSRGTLLLKDELASMFEFARYANSSGAAERAFYLEAYEGNSYTVQRVSRDSVHIENAGLTIYGGIQPDRLAAFKDLETDGMIQRFLVMRPALVAIERPDLVVRNKDRLDGAIDRLAEMTAQNYHATPCGAEMILATRRDGAEFATISDYGKGFQGFASKLGGTHARLAMVTHMLDQPERPQVSDDAIERAGRLLHGFLLPHALGFYATLPTTPTSKVRDIASWLLTKAGPRVLASDLTTGVKSCRGMDPKGLAEVLGPFVGGGWLEPEEPYPSNRAWIFNPDIRLAFAERAEAERKRRAAVSALIGRIGGNRKA